MSKLPCLFDVILVDDEPVICEGLKNLINWEEFGFTVKGAASNGIDALELIPDCGPLLVIADIKMPKMDGIELLRVIREKNPDAGVIILTGFADFNYARSALKYGAIEYLLKPVDDEELTEILPQFYKRLSAAVIPVKKRANSNLGIVAQILPYIEERSNENLTLKEVADHFFINPAYLGQQFKHKMGISFKDYITGQKIERAKELLVQTDLSVAEISYQLGFDNANYFSSLFSRRAGETPTEYRIAHGRQAYSAGD